MTVVGVMGCEGTVVLVVVLGVGVFPISDNVVYVVGVGEIDENVMMDLGIGGADG